MNVLQYPLHLCRKFERRWSAKVVQDDGEMTASQATVGCAVCGRLAAAPVHSTYLPIGKFVYQWRCSVCRNSWQTSADPASGTEIQVSRSGHLRENAGRCLTLEGTAPSDAARKRYRRMGDAWLALAETEDWLDGAVPPVLRPKKAQA
ncbi:hypothetical protein ABIA00_008068 [Bradyrhizobium ottawaense]|uniref:hypothetical protein n=1 Tax=Bradyrhizobium TaxID=374 RepID=UPI0012A09E38|nr:MULTISPECIES: hypothetical protein [Bradyrhizobium]BBO13339.1 hypothetical protein TM102_48090 [Bradyrhizobium sp. TM102]